MNGLEYTDDELRENHEFVARFERLRRRIGVNDMDDAVLSANAGAIGLSFETLRLARHIRNALAHDSEVNRGTLAQLLRQLRSLDEPNASRASASQPKRMAVGNEDVGQRAFRVHAWTDPRLEALMLAHGFVSIGGDEIGDLSNVTDPDEIRATLTRTMHDRTERAINLFVGYWRRFLWDASEGDLVVLPLRDRTVAVGEFAGPYFYVTEAEPRARHRRNVAWFATHLDRALFDADLVTVLNGQHTVQDFRAVDAADRLRDLARGRTSAITLDRLT